MATYEYDSYSSGSALTFQAVSGLSLYADQSRVKGLKTYEKILNTDNSTYTERRFYYNLKGRLVQIVERNHLGYTSRYSYEYDFAGNTLTAHESHQINASTTHTVLKRNTFDHRNRLLTATTTLNGGTPATVTYTYDEQGMTKTKKLGSASTVTNQYNIQGWLTSQSSAKFSLALDYFGAGKRSGNITKLSWGQGASTDQYYTLSYDLLGRLTSGVHSLGKYNETIGSYDLNGNIKSLTRTANGATSDNFTYTYTGNRLTSLSGISGSYTYDASGNLINDPRKNLSFTYNSLNLLQEVKTGSTVKAKYLYSYDGKKMRVLDAGGTNRYEYLGGLTLVKTNNAFTPEYHFGEGIIRGTEVMYFEKDHLGSVRAMLNTSGTVLEKNDYYPFGLRHANSSHVVSANNRYKFNGKEDQTVGALNLLDYGARMYDQQLGRWLGIDPLADSFYSTSPYVYCNDNPIRYVDPNGMIWDDPKEAERLRKEIEKKIKALQEEIQKNQTKLQTKELKQKKIDKLQHKISDNQSRINYLNMSRNDIQRLGADPDNTYILSRINGGHHYVKKDDSSGKVLIETSFTAISLHEISHVRQSLDAGGLDFHNNMLKNVGSGMRGIAANEVEAYRIQYSFDTSFPGRTGGKGVEGIDVHSVGAIWDTEKQGPVYRIIYDYSNAIKKAPNNQTP